MGWRCWSSLECFELCPGTSCRQSRSTCHGGHWRCWVEQQWHIEWGIWHIDKFHWIWKSYELRNFCPDHHWKCGCCFGIDDGHGKYLPSTLDTTTRTVSPMVTSSN